MNNLDLFEHIVHQMLRSPKMLDEQLIKQPRLCSIGFFFHKTKRNLSGGKFSSPSHSL